MKELIAELQRSTRNGRGETTPNHYRIQYWQCYDNEDGLLYEPHHSTTWLPTTFENFVTTELFEDDQPTSDTVLIRCGSYTRFFYHFAPERELTADQVIELGEAFFLKEDNR